MSDDYYRLMNKKNKTKKMSNWVILFLFLILIAFLIKWLMPSFEEVDYRESILLEEGEIGVNVQLENIQMENKPILQESEIYLPIDFVKEYIDQYIFWDTEENKLIITNEHNVIRMQTDQLEYFVNNETLKLDLPIYSIDEIAYMPYSFLKDFYSLHFKYIQETNILDIIKSDYKMATVGKSVRIRQEADKESAYFDILNRGDVVYFNESDVDVESDYVRVETQLGYVGYIPQKCISNIDDISVKSDYEQDYSTKTPWKPTEGKINLVFDQVTNVIANSSESRREYHDGVDVLVPTWFSFENEDGDIKNIADKSYVNWAHDNGYQVWGLLTDNFNSTISHAVLSSTEIREHVIRQLLAFVSLYDLDGINIDFESVPTKDGEYFIQFLRELAPLLKQAGALLSVDLFVPKPWTEHYNRKEVAKVSDYVIVMGYDEHYAGSPVAGSVATKSWSEIAIVDTLAQDVPKEKLILGVPFYNRIWIETLENGEIKLSSKAYGMQGAYDFVMEKGGEFEWLEEVGQYYAEIVEDNVTYKVWLEDERSMEERLNLVLEYDIAGVGAWKRGLEKDEIWTVLKEKLK